MNAALAHDNRTKLADIQFTETAAAKHVNAATGLAEAMVESIQQDLKLFEAMMAVDALELKYKASGSVNESTIIALREGALDKIKTAIVTALRWLVGKLKAAKDAIVKFVKNKLDEDYRMLAKYENKIKKHASELVPFSIDIIVPKHFYEGRGMDYTVFPNPFDIDDAKHFDDLVDNEYSGVFYYARVNGLDNYINKRISVEYANGYGPLESKQVATRYTIGTDKDLIEVLDEFKKLKKTLDEYDSRYSAFIKSIDKQAAMIEKSPSSLGLDEEHAPKIGKILGYYKIYALRYCEISKELLLTDIRVRRTIISTAIGKLNNVDESTIELYTEMSMHEFYDDLSNTYNDEDVDPATEAPQTADDTVIAAASDPESVIDNDELHVEQVILY